MANQEMNETIRQGFGRGAAPRPEPPKKGKPVSEQSPEELIGSLSEITDELARRLTEETPEAGDVPLDPIEKRA